MQLQNQRGKTFKKKEKVPLYSKFQKISKFKHYNIAKLEFLKIPLKIFSKGLF